MSEKTLSRWNGLKQRGLFEEEKARLSVLALDPSAIRVTTIESAMSGATPALSTVRKYQGDELAKDAVVEIITEAALMLNIGKNLKTHQIEFLADEILLNWYYLTLEEIKYLMRQGITGKYGELYDRLDVAVISGWLERYDEQRTAQIEKERQGEAAQTSEGNAKEMPDWFLDFAQKFMAQNTERKPGGEFQPDEAFEAMVRQEWEQMQAGKRPPFFEQFLKLRTAQTKAMLKR